MVILEYAKESEHIPPLVHRVTVKPSPFPARPLLTSVPANRTMNRSELCWLAPPGPDNGAWAPDLARAIKRLGWNHWWLDAPAFRNVLDCGAMAPFADYLERFLAVYDADAIIKIVDPDEAAAMKNLIVNLCRRLPQARQGEFHDEVEVQEREAARGPGKKFSLAPSRLLAKLASLTQKL